MSTDHETDDEYTLEQRVEFLEARISNVEMELDGEGDDDEADSGDGSYDEVLFRLFGDRADEFHSYIDLDTMVESPAGNIVVTPDNTGSWYLQAWLGDQLGWTDVTMNEPFNWGKKHRLFSPVHGEPGAVELQSARDWDVLGHYLTLSILNGMLRDVRRREDEQTDAATAG